MKTLCALTVDVEPDWGIAGDQGCTRGLVRIYALLSARGIKATFFVTGRIAEQFPNAIRSLGQNHELASHGHTHRPLDRLTPDEVREELTASKNAIEALGVTVRGFRAPYLAVPSGWPAPLADAGYQYDSSFGSLLPTPRSAPAPGTVASRVTLLPVATMSDAVPFTLTWIRLLGVSHVQPSNGDVFLMHAHEFVPPAVTRPWQGPWKWLRQRRCGPWSEEFLIRLLERDDVEFVTCGEMAERLRP